MHDLACGGIIRIQIEKLCFLIIRYMMIDVEHVHRIHGRHDCPRTLQFDIADDQQIGSITHALFRPRNRLYARKDVEDPWDLIVNEHMRILPLGTKEVHEAERRTDGITIGPNMGGENYSLRILEQLCRLIK